MKPPTLRPKNSRYNCLYYQKEGGILCYLHHMKWIRKYANRNYINRNKNYIDDQRKLITKQKQIIAEQKEFMDVQGNLINKFFKILNDPSLDKETL